MSDLDMCAVTIHVNHRDILICLSASEHFAGN